MSNATHTTTRRQKLIAGGLVAVLALLSIQTYGLLSGMADASTGASGVHDASGSTNPANNGSLTVSGTGQVQIQPDRAILTIGVTTQATTAANAVKDNARMMSGVISALEALGISNSSIQTTSYNIYPQSNYNGTMPTISGYQVTNEVEVTIIAANQTLGQLGSKVGQAIDASVSHGANDIYGVQFTASQSAISQAAQKALQLAVQNASSQAKIIASALGVSVTGVLSVNASPNYSVPSPIEYGAATSTTGSVSTPIVPQQALDVSASVQVVYSIG